MLGDSGTPSFRCGLSQEYRFGSFHIDQMSTLVKCSPAAVVNLPNSLAFGR